MTTEVTFEPHEVMDWVPMNPPHWWTAAGAFVIADRHLPDGTRQHMIRGPAQPGLVIANAQVISEI
ncbi:hypothetical protein [Hydrogenophaga sp. 2FB]|uniref:hypothetical protein n=1 Tax=Hydrogenophaga sp. 2FB TaxID=2502187 RepID=UPI0010F57879|nr:hypothetical protein [Hydrogenophaga sp. 2FB]